MATPTHCHGHSCEDRYVIRTMKCVPDKLIELCHMHLAFLLDLSGDKLELLLATEREQKRKKSGPGVFKKKEKCLPGLFGAPLTDEGVCLMIPLIKFLSLDKNVSKEGLFRKPGNKNRMMILRSLLLEQGPGTSIDPEVYTPYDVACVLKEFLRELPEPLLTERYMEAHRQVLALGQNAKTPQEVAHFACRKLSALQLLMLLLPQPVQKLIMNLLRLLQTITECPDTKMTSATLGTIFAPIFFINRKLDPSKLCREIKHTAPAMSFMIEKAQELFQAPKELVLDLISYWSDLEQAPSQSQSSPMMKTLNGWALNTNVCYADRKLSQCADVTSNTQAELASLIAHVQSLPSTQKNERLKKQLLKTAATPVMANKRRSHSKSLRASVKKRLSSLGRSKQSCSDSQSVSPSSACRRESKITNVVKRDCEPRSHMLEVNDSQRHPRSQQKQNLTGKSTSMDTSHSCSPHDQECKGNQSCTTVVTSDRNEILTKSCSRYHAENKDPLTPVSDLKLLGLSDIVTPVCLPRADPICLPSVTSLCIQSETPVKCSPSQPSEQISMPASHDSGQRVAIRRHRRPCRRPGTPIMPRAVMQLLEDDDMDLSF